MVGKNLKMGLVDAIQPGTVGFDGDSLTLENLVRVAAGRTKVALSAQAEERIVASRRILEQCAAQGQSIYGMNTNLGPYLAQTLTDAEMSKTQERLIQEHVVRQGTELSVTQVRAMMAARLNCFCKGTSGIRLQTAHALANLLNHEVHPIVVAGGSVGASDLSEMAQIALVLIGEGEAEYRGQRVSGATALALSGLRPIELAGKEAIALISFNGFSVGVGSLVVHNLVNAFISLNLAAATSLEAIQGNVSPLFAGAAIAKAHPGYLGSAKLLREMLDGSSLWQEGAARSLQDPLSFRCIAPVHGALFDSLLRLRETIEIELNSGSDNPFVDIANESVYSVANFDASSLSLAFDNVRIAMTTAINMMNERIQKLLNTDFTGLPTGLKSPERNGVGFIPLARLVAALTAEANLLASPMSIGFRSQLGAGHEDSVSLAPLSVTNTVKLTDIALKVAAVEILIACAALELGPTREYSLTTQSVTKFVKASSLDCSNWDRQISRVMTRMKSGRFFKHLSRDYWCK